MNITSILIFAIITLVGFVLSTGQSINWCRKWFNPRSCRSRGCYWSWDDYECYPLWYIPNGGGANNNYTIGRRRGRIGSTFIGSAPR